MALVLIGCEDKPSRKNALYQVGYWLGASEISDIPKVGDVLTVSDFSYDNGYADSPGHYMVIASWNVKILKSANDLQELSKQDQDDVRMNIDLGLLALDLEYGDNFKAGDIFHCSNEFPFLKTENGWVIQQPTSQRSRCTK